MLRLQNTRSQLSVASFLTLNFSYFRLFPAYIACPMSLVSFPNNTCIHCAVGVIAF